MLSGCRVGDLWVGICMCHKSPIPMTGKILTGNPKNKSGNISQATINSLVLGSCGHMGRIITGSSKTKVGNIGKAIVTSQTVGCLIGIIVAGNPTHKIG